MPGCVDSRGGAADRTVGGRARTPSATPGALVASGTSPAPGALAAAGTSAARGALAAPSAPGTHRRRTRWASTRTSGAHGFTLIELLVIIVILGILVAVAIPIFLRQTNLAKETSSEAMLKGMGGVAYVAINENLDAAEIAQEVALGTRTDIKVTYTAGASSAGPKDVVALVPNGENPGEWLGAVQPRPGRCTVINVTDANGIIAARTGDAVDGQCRADLGSSLRLGSADFLNVVYNPQAGGRAAVPKWVDGVLQLGYGMLLNDPTKTSLSDGSLSAKIKLSSTSPSGGLAFRGSTTASGIYSGYVYQIDPAETYGSPTGHMIIRKWVAGKEVGTAMKVPIPAGVNPRDANNLQINLDGNNFTALLNGATVGSGTLDPSLNGTAYGVRNGTAKVNEVSDLTLTPGG